MDLQPLISKLHPFERKVLPLLKQEKEFSKLVQHSGLQEVEVMRALQWLENKQVLKLQTEEKKVVSLDKNGLKYQREGLPEKKFLQVLTDKYQSLSEIQKKSKLDGEEVNACIGVLKGKLAIEIKKEKELMIKLGPQGKKIIEEGTFEDKFLGRSFPLDLNSIQDIEKLAL